VQALAASNGNANPSSPSQTEINSSGFSLLDLHRVNLNDARFRSPERFEQNVLRNRVVKGNALASFRLPNGQSSAERPDLVEAYKSYLVTGKASNETCDMCLEAFRMLQNITSQFGGDWLYKNLVPVCDVIWPYIPQIIQKDYCDVSIQDECRDLCVGMLYSWRNVAADVIAAVFLQPETSCEKLNMCPHIDPPTPKPPVYPKTIVQSAGKPDPRQTVSRIFHISDIHWDRSYAVGAITDCNMPVCCHPKYQPVKRGAGQWGDYSCDTPDVLVKSALAQIPEHDVLHVIFTGDAPAHDLWLQTHETNVEAILNVTEWALTAAGPKVKFWPTLGNHAAAPVDEFGGPAKDFWLYGPVADAWGKFLPKSAEVTLRWGGFYTAVMEPGLHIISLQTNYYDSLNFYLKLADHWDMAGQIAWFEDVLSQIDKLGEKAIVIGHEKPGSMMPGIWPQEFTRIISKYSHVITGLYFGHNHNDMFHVIKCTEDSKKYKKGEPCGVVMIPSSLTPVEYSTNPSFRVYLMDAQNKTLIDFVQYRMNLTEANIAGFPTWRPAYTARGLYQLRDLSPLSWYDAAVRVGRNETLWHMFRDAFHGGLENYKDKSSVDKDAKTASCFLQSNLDSEFRECLAKSGVPTNDETDPANIKMYDPSPMARHAREFYYRVMKQAKSPAV